MAARSVSAIERRHPSLSASRKWADCGKGCLSPGSAKLFLQFQSYQNIIMQNKRSIING